MQSYEDKSAKLRRRKPYLNKELTDIFSPPYQHLTQYNCALIDNIFIPILALITWNQFHQSFYLWKAFFNSNFIFSR